MKAKTFLTVSGLLLLLVGIGLIGTFAYASLQPLTLTSNESSFMAFQYSTSPQAIIYNDVGGSVTIDWYLDGNLVQEDLDVSASATYNIPTNIAIGVHDLYAIDNMGNIVDFKVTIISSTNPTPTPIVTPSTHPTASVSSNPFKTPSATSIIPSDPLERNLIAVVGALFTAAGVFSLWLKTRFY